MSYLVLPDGTIQVSTEQEALALRAHLLTATPDIAALEAQLRDLRDVVRACQDELGGADPQELAGLIRKLRLMQPNDQLRIERNYWRGRSMELGEEVVIWQRRAGRDVLPTTAVFADLQAKVAAAASSYLHELDAVRGVSREMFLRDAERTRPGQDPKDAEACAVSVSSDPEQVESPTPRQELRQLREQLGMSQRELAFALRMTQSRISLLERGAARVPEDVLAAARNLAAERAAAPRAASTEPPERQDQDAGTAPADDLAELESLDPDADSNEDAYLEGHAP